MQGGNVSERLPDDSSTEALRSESSEGEVESDMPWKQCVVEVNHANFPGKATTTLVQDTYPLVVGLHLIHMSTSCTSFLGRR
jgi:hypothetical protein